MSQLLKKPSAWIPMALTIGILSVLGLYFAGVLPPDPTGDEGTGAHLFQLWLVLEVLSVAFFTLKWLPQTPQSAARVLALQILLALVPLSIVFYFQL